VILPRTARLSRASLVTVGLLLAVFGAANLAGDHGDHASSGPAALLQVAAGGQQAVAAAPGERSLPVALNVFAIAALVVLAALIAGWSLAAVSEHRVAAAPVPLGWRRRGPPLPFTA
jgi:hypothetical protein